MKRIVRIGMTALLCISILPFSKAQLSKADAVIENEDTGYDRYIAFGNDLKANEKNAVLQQKIFLLTRPFRLQTKKSMTTWEIILLLL